MLTHTQGLEDAMPPLYANTTGEGWPETPGAACNMDSTSTWSNRDAMRSALTEFCSGIQILAAYQWYKDIMLTSMPRYRRR